MIRDVLAGAQAQKLMSHVTMTFTLAAAAGPIIGGWLHAWWGWRSVFWFLALSSASILYLTWACLPETLPATQRQSVRVRPVVRAYAQALANRGFMRLVAVLALVFAGLFLYIASAPVLLFDVLHFAPEEFGWFFIPIIAGITLGAFVSGAAADRLRPNQTINLGFALLGSAVILNMLQALLLPPNTFLVVAPVVLYAAGMAVTSPSLTLLALDNYPKRRGLASAVQGFTETMVNAFVAGMLSPLFSHHVWTLALGMLGLLVMAYLLWWMGTSK